MKSKAKYLILFIYLLFNITIKADNLESLGCNDIDIYSSETIFLSNLSSGNSFNSTSFSCIPNVNGNFNGNDILVRFYRSSFQVENWISLWNYSSSDFDIFVFDDCPLTNPSANCIASSDNGVKNCSSGNLNFENIQLANLSSGYYYILIDAQYSTTFENNISLSVSSEGLDCSYANSLQCGANYGDNTGFYNSTANYYGCYDNLGCFNYNNTANNLGFQGAFTSGEEIWEFVAPSSGNYSFVLDPDSYDDLELFLINECCVGEYDNGGVYVITDVEGCFGVNNCEKASTNSAGNNETIEKYMTQGESIFLIVDGFLGDEGSYQLSVNCGTTDCSSLTDLYCDYLVSDNNDPNYSNQATDILDTHPTGTLSDGFYSSTLSNTVEFEEHERIFKSDIYTTGHLTIDVKPKDYNLDVDLFVYETCNDYIDPTTLEHGNSSDTREASSSFYLYNCLYRSVESKGLVDAVFIDNPYGSYYIAVDGQTEYANNLNTEGAFDIVLTCGQLTDHTINNITCGETQSTTQYEGNHASYYSCDERNFKAGNYGPEKIYRYEHSGGKFNLELEILDNADLNLYLLKSPSVKDCIEKSKTLEKGIGSKESIEVINLDAGTYYIVVDGYCGDYGVFNLTIDCDDDLCDVFSPIYEDDFYESFYYYYLNDNIAYLNPTWWSGNGIVKDIGVTNNGIHLEDQSTLTFNGHSYGTSKMSFDLGMKYEGNQHLLSGFINLSPTQGFQTLLNYYFIEYGYDTALGGNYAKLCSQDNSGNKTCHLNNSNETLWQVLNKNNNNVFYNNFSVIYNTASLHFKLFINDVLFYEAYNVAHTGVEFSTSNGGLYLDNVSYGHCTECISYVLNESASYELTPTFMNEGGLNASYVVASGPDGYLDTTYLTGNSPLDFYCPFPGYWEYCFWYQDANGNLEYCCVPYCAYSPVIECDDLNVYYNDYDPNTGKYNYTFSCGEIAAQSNLNAFGTNGENDMYWSLDGTRLVDYDGSTTCGLSLPHGQYTICCWHWDYFCGGYVPCCKTICLEPYNITYPQCLDLDYIQGTADNPLGVLFSSENTIGLVNWEIVGVANNITPDIITGDFSYSFSSYGEYTICGYYEPNQDNIVLLEPCCTTICLTDPYVCSGNIGVLPFDGNEVQFFNNNNSEALYWEVVSDNVEMQVVGESPSLILPGYGTYTVCMYYLDACCNLNFCCFEFCYSDPFACGYIEPYYVGENGALTYSFTLDQSAINSGLQAGTWVIDGQNTVMGIGNDINYTFSTPGEFDISVNVWDPISNCWKICCRRICVLDPFACDNVSVDYKGTSSEPYKYKFTLDDPDAVQIEWILHKNNTNIVLPGNSNMISVNLADYGVNTGDEIGFTVRYYNNYTKCWKFCCKRLCIVNPFSCNNLTAMDISTGNNPYKYKFTLNSNNATEIKWTLHRNGTDITLPGSQKMIEVDFEDYNISPNDNIGVTVRWYDPYTRCWKFCCKEISLTPPQDAVIFDIGEVCGGVGSIVHIPITVLEFNSINVFGFELIHSSNKIKFKGISGVDSRLNGLSNGTTGIFDKKLIIGWDHPQSSVVTIEDNAVIFYVDVEILQDFTNPISITGNNVVVGGNQGQSIAAAIYGGEVCIANVFSISGEVKTFNGNIRESVDVNLGGTQSGSTMTNNNGHYSFNNVIGGDCQIDAYDNSNIRNGVNIIDVAKIRWHYIQKVPINNDYNLIAADVNHDGVINILDVGLARKIYLQKITVIPNNNSWRFIPEALNISSNPLDVNLNEKIEFNPLGQSVYDADFVAVKVADVDNTASLIIEEISNEWRSGGLEFSVANRNVIAGQQIEIPITVKEFNNIIVFGFEMRWDSSFMELDDVVVDFDSFNSGNYNMSKGKLIVGWDEVNASGIDISDGQILKLLFNVKPEAEGTSSLTFHEMVAADGDFDNVSISGVDADLMVVPEATNVVPLSDIKVFPNPFEQGLTIQFEEEVKEDLKIEVYGVNGQLISSKRYEENVNQLHLPESSFGDNGLYIVKISSPSFQLIKKVIKM